MLLEELEIPAWPPMCNVAHTPIDTERGLLVLRVEGTLQSGSLAIDVSFEAVKGSDSKGAERDGAEDP